MSELENSLARMAAHNINASVIHFIRLQFVAGLRISDLLRIRREDISVNSQIYIRQSKGSNPLVVNVLYESTFFDEYRRGFHTDISLFSVSFFYKLYKRYSIGISNGEGHNESITHAGRKLLARSMFDLSGDISVAASALGHRSSRSTMYYLTSEQKKLITKNGVLSNVRGSDSKFKTRNINGRNFIYLSDIQ